MTDCITTTEAAARLGITPGRMRQLVVAKRLPVHRLGRDNMILPADLDLVRDRVRTGRPPGTPQKKRKKKPGKAASR